MRLASVEWRHGIEVEQRAIDAHAHLTGFANGIEDFGVLAFARALGDFGATLMLAGDIPGKTQTASIAIYDAVESGNTQLARVLVLVLSVAAMAIVYGANRLQQRQVTG